MGPSIFLSFSKMKSVCATLIYHHLECPLSTHHTLTIKIPRIRSKRWLSGLSSLPPSLITSAHHQVPCGETSSCKMTSDLHSLPEARAHTHTHTPRIIYVSLNFHSSSKRLFDTQHKGTYKPQNF